MEDEYGNLKQPNDSDVFTQTNGEKVRIEYEKVFSYSSKNKSLSTVIEYGWGDDKETFILDIDFEAFDDKLTHYKKEIKKYWAARERELASVRPY